MPRHREEGPTHAGTGSMLAPRPLDSSPKDGPLGRMGYLEIAPDPALRPYVQLIWCVEFDAATNFGPERIAPDGIVELVLHFRGRVHLGFPEQLATAQSSSFVICQTQHFVDITAPDVLGFVSVRFLPWGAVHFVPMPVSELADRVVPADEVWGGTMAVLEERLAGAKSARERVELVEAFLLELLRRYRKDDVEAAVREVWRLGGNLRVPELCHDLGVSQRTAQRVFNAAVGLPPKRYGRLVRFMNACSLLRERGARAIGEVGHVCGYYDQAHFDTDFKAFSGLTPSEFMVTDRVSFLRSPNRLASYSWGGDFSSCIILQT